MAKRRFQPTPSRDGEFRISLPITYRVSAWEVAAHIVEYSYMLDATLQVSDDPQRWAGVLDRQSNTALLNIVKKSINVSGDDIYTRVGDFHDMGTMADNLEPYIARRFGFPVEKPAVSDSGEDT